jgi:hypothetical protein
MNEGQMEEAETERNFFLPDKFHNIYHAYLVLQRTLIYRNLTQISI